MIFSDAFIFYGPCFVEDPEWPEQGGGGWMCFQHGDRVKKGALDDVWKDWSREKRTPARKGHWGGARFREDDGTAFARSL